MAKLKQKHQQELFAIESDITRLTQSYEREFRQQGSDLSLRLSNVSKELSRKEYEIYEKNQIMDNLRQENAAMQELYEKLQNDNKEALVDFEQKLN